MNNFYIYIPVPRELFNELRRDKTTVQNSLHITKIRQNEHKFVPKVEFMINQDNLAINWGQPRLIRASLGHLCQSGSIWG